MTITPRGDGYTTPAEATDEFSALCGRLQDPVHRGAISQDEIDRILARVGRTRDELAAAMAARLTLR